MGKKKKSELDKQFADFEAGMLSNGYSAPAVKILWDTLMPFADYAFNKAHSAGYGVLSYWTAYLKANYPAEYMAALLTSVGDSKDKLGIYLSECRRMGLNVLAPDVNESDGVFSAVGSDIRFGMGAIRNVGFGVVEHIKASRADKGRFTTFHDFLKKVPVQVANKKTLESLIKAGAFDAMGNTRRALVEIHEEAVESAVSLKRNEALGQVDLFGDMFEFAEEHSQVPDRPEFTKRDKLAFEREMLGLYVSDHPLAGLELQLAKHATVTINDLTTSDQTLDGDIVTLAGLVTEVQRRIAKKSGNAYGIIKLEDFGGEMDIMLLGRTYQEFGPMLETDMVLAVKGRVNVRDDGLNIQAMSMFVPDVGPVAGVQGPLNLVIPEVRATNSTIGELSAVLSRHPGESEVRLRLTRGVTARVFELPARVNVSSDLFGELKSLLGPGCLG
jgi:DNA polymerase-3 subunit alpha